MRRVLTSVVVLVLLPMASAAQSLGDLARAEAARRRAIVEPVVLVTNADLEVRPAPVPPSLPPFPDLPIFGPPSSLAAASPPSIMLEAPTPEAAAAGPNLVGPLGALAGRWNSPGGIAHRDRRPPAPRPPATRPVAPIAPFRNPIVDALFDRRP